MTLKSREVAVLSFVFVFGGILLSMALNLWKTESGKVPIKLPDGRYNPADIRGSYSFENLEDLFDIPAKILADAFGLSQNGIDAGSWKAKDVEELYGPQKGDTEIGTDSIRLFTALWKDIPYQGEETTVLPGSAFRVLKEQNKLTPEEQTALRPRVITPVKAEEALQEEPSSGPEEEKIIKGKTTFGDLYSWGLSQEEVTGTLGKDPGPRSMTVRDFCMDNGLEFSTVKTALQNLIDAP